MGDNQIAAEIILTLKRTLTFNEKKLLQKGTILPVIISVRKRSKKFYLFALVTANLLVILSLTRVLFFDSSFLGVLLPIFFGVFLGYFVRKNYNHVEEILRKSESKLTSP